MGLRMHAAVKTLVAEKRTAILTKKGQIEKFNPKQKLQAYQERCHFLTEQITNNMAHFMSRSHTRTQHLAHALNMVSPLATLERGYAIVTDDKQRVVQNASTLKAGDEINTRLATGRVRSLVKKIEADSEE